MTGREVIERALALIKVTGSGETADADDLLLALKALNAMIEHWASMQPSTVLVPHMQALTLTAGKAVYTIGQTVLPALPADFVAPRPASLHDASFVRYQQSDAPLRLVTLAQYNSLAYKTGGGWPAVLYYEPGPVVGTITLYPVPTDGMVLYLASRDAFAQFPDLDTDIAFAPGYKRALQYCLACEISDDFSRPIPARVERTARTTLRELKQANTIVPVLGLPAEVRSGYGSDWVGDS